jgi:peptidyl-prolyl cis-trans isomerase C
MRQVASIFILLLALALGACQSTSNGQALMAPPGGPVAFRIGGTTVTVADVQRRLEREIGPALSDLIAQGQTPEQIEELANQNNIRSAIFDRMIQDELLMLYARRNGVGVSPAAVDAAALAQAPTDAETAFVDLTEQRVAAARGQLAFEVIARNTRADMYHARHILVADQAAADELLAELKAGADFAALARERSQDQASAAEGGDLGWQPRGNFVPEFDDAGFSLPLNTPGTVASQFGVHVIEVLGREQARPFENFEQLQASQSAQQFYEESFIPWYNQLLSDAQASGELELAAGFDPNSVPLPFPDAP